MTGCVQPWVLYWTNGREGISPPYKVDNGGDRTLSV